MSDQQQQQQYQNLAQAKEPQRPVFINCLRAFLVGGTICTIGQGLTWFFMTYFNFDEKTAGNPAVAALVFLSALITSLGVYDNIAQWGGAGTAVPITGFANNIAAAALDHRSEGYVLGVGGNMFRIAGPVIVYGVFSAFIVAIIVVVYKGLGGG